MKKEKSCGAIVYRKKEGVIQFLLIHQTLGHWTFPKGHVEGHESLIETAQREIAEETGITGYIVATLGYIDYWFTSSGQRIHKTVHHYLFCATGGRLTIEHDPDHEAVDVAWVPLAELSQKLSFANERRIADIAREYINTQL